MGFASMGLASVDLASVGSLIIVEPQENRSCIEFQIFPLKRLGLDWDMIPQETRLVIPSVIPSVIPQLKWEDKRTTNS